MGWAYSGGTPGPCKAGETHDVSASADYSLLHDVGSAMAKTNGAFTRRAN
jgi:hypothetical protein